MLYEWQYICLFKALFISNKHKVMEDYAVCSDVVFGMEASVGPIYDATDITMLSQHFARHYLMDWTGVDDCG